MKSSWVAAGVGAMWLWGGAALAQQAQPERDVGMAKHPHIAEAQKLSAKAYQEVLSAQKAHEGELGGHAQKAKELLEQVNAELKMAAEVANQSKK